MSGHNLSGTHGLVHTKHSPFKGTEQVTGCTSAHHQAVKIPDGKQSGVLLAYETYGAGCLVQAKANNHITKWLKKVPEAMWWPQTHSFGVQGHPEYRQASNEYSEYVFQLLLDDDDIGYYNTLLDSFVA